MKTSIIKNFILPLSFVLGTLSLHSCKKDKPCTDNGLPCLTSEGKNTFGCLIDGVPFVASVKFTVGGPVAVSGSFDEETKLLIIQGVRGNDDGAIDDVRFRCYVLNGIDTYNMYIISSAYKGYINYVGSCSYYHDTNAPGTLKVVHLDTEENIISGTFSMTLINADCAKESILITNGRFDFGY